MKKLFFMLTCLLSVFPILAQSTVDINGTSYPIDTTAHYQTGPGVWHTRYTVKIGSNTHNCYLLEVDLTNPYNTIEEWQSSKEIGKTQRLADAYKQLDAINHRPIGGVNCNFWVVTANVNSDPQGLTGLLGQPFAGTARNGVIIGEPSNWNAGHGDRGYIMIDRDKRVWIEDMLFDGVLTTTDSLTYPIRDVNRQRVTPNPDEVALFNHYLGNKVTRSTDGIEIIFNTQEWEINGDMTCVVSSVNSTGGTLLTEGEGALQGRGSGKVFLENLKVGDVFTLHLGVVSSKDANFRPDILQMVTGNCLVMRNGVLTNRNTNEDYNNRNYPRTMLATNNEGNKFWMMVAEKPGMFTAQMCALLRHAGATYAAGMDGGGSAQMCLGGNVINPTTEGSPRAVANSIWVLSTAPDDSVVTRLEYPEDKIRLPKYGVFAPRFRSYNQYGVLLSHSQANVKLSCDESVGYINEDGHFICLGAGLLTATCDNATKTFQVELEPTTGLDILLDSVIVMNNTDYLIEIHATAAGVTLPIFASAVKWTVEDSTLCSVSSEGILNGTANGKTYVYGELDGNRDSVFVSIEIPESNPLCINTFSGEDIDLWTIKASSSSWNTEITLDAEGKSTIGFTYTPTRVPNIELQSNIRFYGLPSSISLPILIEKDILKNINFTLQAANQDKQILHQIQDIKVGEQDLITLDIEEIFGSYIGIHPIHLGGIQFNLNTGALTKGEYCTIKLDGLLLHYGELSVGFDNILSSSFNVYPNPTQDILYINGLEDNTNIALYDLQGKCIVKTTIYQDGYIHINTLHSGTYLLQVGNETVKIIKQ